MLVKKRGKKGKEKQVYWWKQCLGLPKNRDGKKGLFSFFFTDASHLQTFKSVICGFMKY